MNPRSFVLTPLLCLTSLSLSFSPLTWASTTVNGDSVEVTVSSLDTGDGSDGEFENGPASIVNDTDQIITFNTSEKDTWNFESFYLEDGWTIQASGSKPLVLKVMGTTFIEGSISLSGAAGGSDSSGSEGGSGGVGGGSGGDAGTTNSTSSQNGQAPSGGFSFAGSKGNDVAAEIGGIYGGGGGCMAKFTQSSYQATAGNRSNSVADAGAAGTCGDSASTVALVGFEEQFAGGAGGGGGGRCVGGGCSPSTSGGGGGGGGGALRIISGGPILITGSLAANGGKGGNATVGDGITNCGGAGGGGSGGAIWLQSSAFVSGETQVSVSGGAAGTTSCSDPSDGGRGSRGVIRIDSTASEITVSGGLFCLQTQTPRSNHSNLPTWIFMFSACGGIWFFFRRTSVSRVG